MTSGSKAQGVLHYVADPMCSWCWGFRSVLDVLSRELPEGLELRHVLGGLAPDSEAPMPESTRRFIQAAWREVEGRTGARFNHDFWTRCEPRRSTYPACRAVLAADAQREGAGPEMFAAIQRAYYLEARNPSDLPTLVSLASEIDPPLDATRFEQDLRSKQIDRRLQEDLVECRRLGVSGFPSLVLEQGGSLRTICHGYTDLETLRTRLFRP